MTTKPMTLCIVRQGNKILLGMKKRGFGMGRWKGFGGKLKEGETIEQAVIREMKEESGLVVENIDLRGILDFEFAKDRGNFLQVHIFKADSFSGELIETEEMKPQWFDISEIPFDSMWSDDKIWIPMFLEDKSFKGRFLFDDNDQILESSIEEAENI